MNAGQGSQPTVSCDLTNGDVLMPNFMVCKFDNECPFLAECGNSLQLV